MSQLPATPVNAVLAISEPTALASVTESFGAEQFSVYNLPKISVPRESVKFLLDTEDGEQAVSELRGVILDTKSRRAYWKSAYGSTAGSAPDCQSNDCTTGTGTPGGACISCPWNQFGTAGMGNGKACREKRVLFFLPEGAYVPSVIELPPSSIKPWQDFKLALMARGSNPSRVITSISLEKVSKGGKTYVSVSFKPAGKLGEADMQAITAYRAALKPLLDSYNVSDAPAEADTYDVPPASAAGIVRDASNNPF